MSRTDSVSWDSSPCPCGGLRVGRKMLSPVMTKQRHRQVRTNWSPAEPGKHGLGEQNQGWH